jgi:opacity protein-like surface antigen
MKRFVCLTLTALALTATPTLAQSIYLGVGPTFPTSDYGDYANTGFMLAGGATFEIATNLDIYGEAFWGQNNHDEEVVGEDSKTNPLGFMAGLLYGFGGEDAAVDPYVFGGAGLMQHRYSSDTFGDDSESAFGFQAGAGMGFALGGLDAFAEGRYTHASYDAESEGADSAVTAFFSIMVGLSFDLGGDS